jgi:tetratricopeptide (TPR) repeat protein
MSSSADSPPPPVDAPEDNGQHLLAAAEQKLQAGTVVEAEPLFRAALALLPNDARALHGLGRCAARRRATVEALALLEEARRAAPENAWIILDFADALRAAGRLKEAEPTYNQALQGTRHTAQVWLGLADCARQRGNHHHALALCHAALLADPENPWGLAGLAAAQAQLGDWAAAEAGFRHAAERAPDNVQVHLGLGHCAEARGDLQAALAHFTRAGQVPNVDFWPRLYVAITQRALGMLDEAEAGFRAVLAEAPEVEQAHLGLGHCALTRGDPRAALAHFTRAVQVPGASLWPGLYVAVCHRALGDLAMAEAGFKTVLAAAPDNVQAHLGLGQCARQRGDSAAALAHFREAERLSPGNEGAGLEIAAEQREAGDFTAARRTVRSVLKRRPQNLHGWLSLGRIMSAAGHYRTARAAFRHAHLLYPKQPEALVEMALSERACGDQAACDAALGAALQLDPGNIQVQLRRAEQAMMAADVEQAYWLYLEAARALPEELEFQFGLIEAQAALGHMDEAMDGVARLEEARGTLPRLTGKRVNLLRRAGDYHAALAASRAATEQFPHLFHLWAERFECEMLVGSEEDIAACLARLPAGTALEKGIAARFAGKVAESQWRLEAARAHYLEAAQTLRNDAAVQYDLARIGLLLLDVPAAQRHLQDFCALNAPVTRLQGRSLNMSQTHLGQVLDEYRLDRETLQKLMAMQALPVRETQTALRRAMLENPDSTAAAISLFLAVRQSGARAAAVDDAAIPAHLVQYWDAEEPPEDIRAIMAYWPRFNPGYQFTLFNNATARAFLSIHFPPAVRQAYEHVREPAQKADIFRLAYLAVAGGIYADADDRCLAPLDSILPRGRNLVLYQEDHGTLGNNFMAAAPRHPVMIEALTRAVNAINRGDTDNVWLATGPALLTRAAAAVLARTMPDADGLLPGMEILHRRDLFQAVAIHCLAGYKVTTRHWSNSSFASQKSKAYKAGLPPGRLAGAHALP